VRGRVVSYGATAGPKVQVDLRHLFWKQLSILGSTMGRPEEFRRVMGLVFEGVVAPVIDRVLPLEKARAAHELLEAGEVFGKLVLVP
jgi:NADPH:quinone reductase-like Zn-dependent oxidoreductase